MPLFTARGRSSTRASGLHSAVKSTAGSSHDVRCGDESGGEASSSPMSASSPSATSPVPAVSDAWSSDKNCIETSSVIAVKEEDEEEPASSSSSSRTRCGPFIISCVSGGSHMSRTVIFPSARIDPYRDGGGGVRSSRAFAAAGPSSTGDGRWAPNCCRNAS